MQVEEMITEYYRQRDELDLFDANCWLGVPLEPGFATVDGLEGMKTKLADCGIRRAVVSHTMCKEYDAATGTRQLIAAIAHHETLFGAATFVPGSLPEDQLREQIRAWITSKIRLVRMFPKSHNFLLSPWYLGDLLSLLEELRLPVVLWHTEVGWEEIARLCGDYPQLPIIVEGTGRKLLYDNRIFYRLFERFPNFYLETHNLTNYLGLDDVVRHFGSERLIFGTYFPQEDPNSTIMPLTHGRLEPADKRNIAHGNLQRLIAEVDQR